MSKSAPRTEASGWAAESHFDHRVVELFERRGFLIIDPQPSRAELHWLGAVFDELFARGTQDPGVGVVDLAGAAVDGVAPVLPQILEPERHVPAIMDTQFHQWARALAGTLLGTKASELRAFSHMILKPARLGRETPWHQDVAYWEPDHSHHAVTFWTALEDVTTESGCMQFLPGSHRRPLAVHNYIDESPRVLLRAEGIDTGSAVSCPMRAGVVSVHHCKTLHYTGPNRTGRDRRAWIQTFVMS